jgi:hypothetical protein
VTAAILAERATKSKQGRRIARQRCSILHASTCVDSPDITPCLTDEAESTRCSTCLRVSLAPRLCNSISMSSTRTWPAPALSTNCHAARATWSTTCKNGVSPRAAPSEKPTEPLSQSNGPLERIGGTRGKVTYNTPETTRPLEIKAKTVFHRLGNTSWITVASRMHVSAMDTAQRAYLFLVEHLLGSGLFTTHHLKFLTTHPLRITRLCLDLLGLATCCIL